MTPGAGRFRRSRAGAILRRYALSLLLAVAAAGAFLFFPEEDAAEADAPFDFWVLALSWSPSFCADGDKADQNQCRERRAFIVHGLWPQYERGYPEFCATTLPGPGPQLLDSIADLIPDAGLARHEWRRHGSCSGLTADAYFQTLRRAAGQVEIPRDFASPNRTRRTAPDAIEQAFRGANPGLSEKDMGVVCADGRFSEIRICLTRDLGFRACPEVDSRGCRAATIAVPASR